MLCFFTLLMGVFSLGSRVVLCSEFKFTFETVAQCEPVSLAFVGSPNPDALPSTLTLLPFNSRPIYIPIPNATANSSGVTVTFLPLAAGTTFVASLDTKTGENVAKVSDITRVIASPTSNGGCLEPPASTKTRLYLLPSSVTQCEEFSISYNRSLITSAPSVRLYNPNGASIILNRTSDNPQAGEAKYLMSFSRNKEITLLMDDGRGNQETSPLFTVGGDSGSDQSCKANSFPSKSSSPQPVPKVPRPLIIGASIGGGAVGFMAIAVVLFVCRERRRRKRIGTSFDPTLLEKGGRKDKAVPHATDGDLKKYPSGFVENPAYTSTDKFMTMRTASGPRSNTSSWSQVLPPDDANAGDRPQVLEQDGPFNAEVSINALNIEDILNLAALPSNASSRANSAPTSPSVGGAMPQTTASPTTRDVLRRPYPARGHFRAPSDVPQGPTSTSFSQFSIDPFSDENSAKRSLAGISQSSGSSQVVSDRALSNIILAGPSNTISQLADGESPLFTTFDSLRPSTTGFAR